MSIPHFKLFVSSPSDARIERERARQRSSPTARISTGFATKSRINAAAGRRASAATNFCWREACRFAEARDMAARYGAELPPAMLAFIAASRRRAGRAQAVAWGAAAVFAMVAVGAGVAAKMAVDQRAIADDQRVRAKKA